MNGALPYGVCCCNCNLRGIWNSAMQADICRGLDIVRTILLKKIYTGMCECSCDEFAVIRQKYRMPQKMPFEISFNQVSFEHVNHQIQSEVVDIDMSMPGTYTEDLV